jgi:hypothetical protein
VRHQIHPMKATSAKNVNTPAVRPTRMFAINGWTPRPMYLRDIFLAVAAR